MAKPDSSINYQISTIPKPRVALVTDWIYGGGGELVVEEFHRLFPEAPIYTSYCSDEWRQRLDGVVVTGYLQRTPFRQLRKFLPLVRQWWFARLGLNQFDLVISITGNGEAKFARTNSGIHISYCHTPVHFYWRHYDEYYIDPGMRPKWLVRLGLKLLVKPLRRRDYKAAQKVDYFIANSSHIKDDIKTFYNRSSALIFPPVDTARFSQISSIKHQVSKPRKGFIMWGRHVPMKRFDLAIQACNELGLHLTIAGSGAITDELKKLAGPNITFTGRVSGEELVALAHQHQAFLFPSYEDFGIAPVEAMAAGLPVIAYRAGGALDYVIAGKTGEFFKQQTVASLKQTLQAFRSAGFNTAALQDKATTFSAANFQHDIKSFISSVTKK